MCPQARFFHPSGDDFYWHIDRYAQSTVTPCANDADCNQGQATGESCDIPSLTCITLFEEFDATTGKMTALTFFNTKRDGMIGSTQAGRSGTGPDGSQGGRVLSTAARTHPDFANNQQYFSYQTGGAEAYLVNTLIAQPDTGIRWGFSWTGPDVSGSPYPLPAFLATLQSLQ